MKRTRLLFVLGLSVSLALVAGMVPAFARVSSPSATITWSSGDPFPQGVTRFDGEYVASVKRVYFLGFRLADNSTDGSVWYYDTVGHTYVDTGVDMPVPISNYEISALRDAHGLGLYVFGGRDNNGDIIKTVQVFYPSDNTTRALTRDPWPGTTPSACVSLPGMGVATYKNHAFVIGGMSFSTSVPPCVDDQSSQTWIFNPAAPAGSKWSPGPALNVARGYITTAVLGGKIYAIGGDTNSAGTLFASNSVEVWQPPSGTWDDAGVADLPVTGGCDESQAFGLGRGSLSPSIILAGCGQWPNSTRFTLQYKPGTDTWSNAGLLIEARRNQAGAMFGTTMYVLGGYDATGAVTLATAEVASAALHGSVASVRGSVRALGGAGTAVTN